jgi:mono/diheme cytochrome c family protein
MARVNWRVEKRLSLIAAAGMCLLLAGWTVALDKDWPVPPDAAKKVNPVKSTPDNLSAAKATWMDKCANCHGEKGAGDGPEADMYTPAPAALNDAHMMNGMTDGEIFYKITEGRKPMPSFKTQLTDEERWELVNFTRTLVVKTPAKPSGTQKPGGSHN